ncbi:hypothetical protein [Dyadobacter psychrophilus]|uniref:5-methylcytosine-specific restriction endonuclease McrBC, GTP-binding regulatory subunit McrB n=1 Tax=Dyadobacter psychrophilus TaxID=651661 RepID=A0A1T5FSV7_9BACT|nr:hypothetical protein [Dyadobacter psychrophilus]SKB99221.1 5-methylcytosine-specific restriction endonuclease McrBC, GTP-binding regulatory subunit McrB [Dyadobacter psychrophilus]
MEYFDELSRFLEQSQTDSLKTAHFADHFNGLKVKLSFGKGNPARVTWIAFLAEGQTITNGIYPFYLYFKKQNLLILGYGLSETIPPNTNWKLANPVRISDYFKRHNFGKPARYGASLVFKAYDPAKMDRAEVEEDLVEIIGIYKQTVGERPVLPKRKPNRKIAFDYKAFQKSIARCNLHINPNFTLRFVTSLLAKPFVILTGLSGSGKTKLAQAFSKWICESEDQICLVAVGADWTNREPLLGYPNALEEGKYVKPDSGVLDLIILAGENPAKPYFLILDEMNLSHVERYFADFLSAMESGGDIRLHPGYTQKHDNVPSRIRLPKNLFIIGTVNIDETTYMFSPKVLDRANVIEFRVIREEMAHFLSLDCTLNLDSISRSGCLMATGFVELVLNKQIEMSDKALINNALLSFFEQLQKAGAEFGYRSAAEIVRFAAIANYIEPEWKVSEIIDAAIVQKLLPKVHGSRRRLEPILKTLAALCGSDADEIENFLNSKKELAELGIVHYPVTLEKLKRMYKSLIDNGFTSFAEA